MQKVPRVGGYALYHPASYSWLSSVYNLDMKSRYENMCKMHIRVHKTWMQLHANGSPRFNVQVQLLG
jgi:hypothetical protein